MKRISNSLTFLVVLILIFNITPSVDLSKSQPTLKFNSLNSVSARQMQNWGYYDSYEIITTYYFDYPGPNGELCSQEVEERIVGYTCDDYPYNECNPGPPSIFTNPLDSFCSDIGQQ